MCVCVCVCRHKDGDVEAMRLLEKTAISGGFTRKLRISADGRSCTRTRHTQSQRYSSPSATGAAFVVDPTPIPSKPAILLPRWTSTRPHHPTTTPPGVPRAGSRTGPPLQSLVTTVAGQPGAPRQPVLWPWRPAAAHPRVFRRGPGQPTLMTVFWPTPFMGKVTGGGGVCVCAVTHTHCIEIHDACIHITAISMYVRQHTWY